MTALPTRRTVARVGRGVTAAALVLAVGGGGMLAGAGSASAAPPTPVTCTLLGGSLNEPVSVKPGEQVQLVLVVPVLGTRVNVGPAQTVGNNPGEQLLQATITNVLGLVGQVCQAAVNVQSTVNSAVPLPPAKLPTLPPGGPSQSVNVPLPGANVGVEQGGQPAPAPPSGGNPEPGAPVPGPPASGTDPRTRPLAPNAPITWRYDNARIPLYDFSAVPYGVGYRFGGTAAPAFRYGQRVPGYAPQFGILGTDPGDDVATVGTVEPLPVGGARVALPVLLAVLLLSAVTGALVRTWTLRRA